MSHVIDHAGYAVSDYEVSKAFYTAVLGTLGIKLLVDFAVGQGRHAGYGKDHPTFWISDGRVGRGQVHVAFTAASRAEVQAFHAVGLSTGGRDNGSPGLRPHYHPNYYGAFILDPDGYNVEAVCHVPQ